MKWGWFILWALIMLLLPLIMEDTYTICVLSIWALLALSLGLMWGFAGILSFGHAAYFGLGAYAYAISAINLGESTGALFLAVLVPALVAAVIGAMMFYGRISDVYLGVITLVVSLILYKFMNATAGDVYRIGDARLGGFNGIPGFPLLNVPGDPSAEIWGTPFYYVVAVALLLCYLVARWVLYSSFGRILTGIRENDLRAELLGYNVPLYKTAIFSLSAAMAGLAGAFFAMWSEIVTPGLFALGQSAEVIIWVIVGGLGTLVGPMAGAAILGMIKLLLGEQTTIDNTLVMGAILVLAVLLIPGGIAPQISAWRKRRMQRFLSSRSQQSGRRRRGRQSSRDSQ
ncbi:urea ABC transporter [Chromatiales bacterium (ex Bugula neritina AB1)]|nr:urea ABC transporter [Chromatiales bacterium (ex Bugula neritina AB1)]